MTNRALDPSTRPYISEKNDQPKIPNILDKTVGMLRNNPYIVAAITIAFMFGYLIASKQEHKQCNNYIKNRSQIKNIKANTSLYSQPTQVPQMQAPQMQAPQMQAPQMQAPQMQAPQMQAPQMQAPQMQAPQVQAPQ